MARRDHQQALFDVAGNQNGYFTAKQALSSGYSYKSLSYHVRVGRWQRIERAIYKLPEFPTQPDDQLVILSLMSTNRSGEPQAVVSHETALAIYGISDANPAKIHLTVPPAYEKVMPRSATLHHERLTQRDWEYHGAYRITTPLRTIQDVASSPTSLPYLEGAIRDALRQGLIRKTHLLAAQTSKRAKLAIQAALGAIESRSAAETITLAGSGTLELKWTASPDITSTNTTFAAHSADDK